LERLIDNLQQDSDQRKGEFVILVRGEEKKSQERVVVDVEQILITLLAELPLKQAVSLASRISGQKKNILYKQALGIIKAQDVM
ncbi:MAG: rRNA (cytidine-2'-O-)-methyltransferase, partial [Candidatus Thiodiazotropha sp.]